MMVGMIFSERNATGYSDRDVTDDCHHFVEEWVWVSAEMGKIVDADMQCMVEKPSE